MFGPRPAWSPPGPCQGVQRANGLVRPTRAWVGVPGAWLPRGSTYRTSWAQGTASVQSPSWEEEGEPFRWAELLGPWAPGPGCGRYPLLSLQLELEMMTNSAQE